MQSRGRGVFPGGYDSEESAFNEGDPEFDLWVGKIPWRKEWLPTSVFLQDRGAWTAWTEELGGLQPMGSQSWTLLND